MVIDPTQIQSENISIDNSPQNSNRKIIKFSKFQPPNNSNNLSETKKELESSSNSSPSKLNSPFKSNQPIIGTNRSRRGLQSITNTSNFHSQQPSSSKIQNSLSRSVFRKSRKPSISTSNNNSLFKNNSNSVFRQQQNTDNFLKVQVRQLDMYL